MGNLLRQKFRVGTELGYKLINTGKVKLIEGNNWRDDYWGVYNGKGKNVLGKLLMEIRNDLKINGKSKSTKKLSKSSNSSSTT